MQQDKEFLYVQNFNLHRHLPSISRSSYKIQADLKWGQRKSTKTQRFVLENSNFPILENEYIRLQHLKGC